MFGVGATILSGSKILRKVSTGFGVVAGAVKLVGGGESAIGGTGLRGVLLVED